ncbi:hypothetical protein TRFO_07307 [Tritrichomonas foetus]|uniref:Uncharacterized protein n=1 Tax=Tritrichomonas foetus TaxID=1144522 RepID=A0A1J4JSR7_9EUKA|nr:hypothetical protein TRFO_07307 [Tritrichomonas foetus]|eukprot:OHT02107.1 hypothetical protein TRFO_07307 [Tritrichomonas foetus]
MIENDSSNISKQEINQDSRNERINRNMMLNNSTDSELPKSCLLSIADDLFSNDQQQIISGIIFFDNYSALYKIPIDVEIKIQPFFVNFLCIPGAPIQLINPCLRVLTSIASSFSDSFDYSQLLCSLIQFLPNYYSFDAICALIGASNIVAFNFSQEPFLTNIDEWLNSNNQDYYSGAIGILNALANHEEISQAIKPIYAKLIDNFSQLNISLKIQCIETFTNLLNVSTFWCSYFENCANLSYIFNYKEDSNQMEALILATLRFLKIFIQNCQCDPIQMIINTQAIDILMNGLTNIKSIIRIESIWSLFYLFHKINETPEFVWRLNIPQILINLDQDDKFSDYEMRIDTLCIICLLSPNVSLFVESNFTQMICDNIDSFSNHVVDKIESAILIMLQFAQSTNNIEYLKNVARNDQLHNYLFKNQTEKASLIMDIIDSVCE